AVVAPPGQQIVPFDQKIAEADQSVAQVSRRVVMVMQVDLDFAVPQPRQFRQIVEILRLVFFDRKEKRVPRRTAVAVAEAAELPRKLVQPMPHAPPALGAARAVRLGLKMVGNAQK